MNLGFDEGRLTDRLIGCLTTGWANHPYKSEDESPKSEDANDKRAFEGADQCLAAQQHFKGLEIIREKANVR